MMITSAGRCKVEKLPALSSSSLGDKNELTGKCKINKVQEGKVKSWRLLQTAKFLMPLNEMCVMEFALNVFFA